MMFGTYLHQQRAAHGLSRKLFADRLEISLAHLSEIEQNREPPSYSEIQRIAVLLQIAPAVLLAQAGYLHHAEPEPIKPYERRPYEPHADQRRQQRSWHGQ